MKNASFSIQIIKQKQTTNDGQWVLDEDTFQTRKLIIILLSHYFVDDQSSVQPYAYFPFGVGPRMCIGNKFAKMEMKVMLANLLRTFSFSEVPGCTVKTVPLLTARPVGLQLLIRPADLDN